MPSVRLIWSTSPRKVVDRVAASLMTATSLGPTPRTRRSGAVSDGWPAIASLDSAAAARDVHPRAAMIAVALAAARRAVVVMALPSSCGVGKRGFNSGRCVRLPVLKAQDSPLLPHQHFSPQGTAEGGVD